MTTVSKVKKSHLKEVMGDKPGRNDPCPCGSGKKFKQCCFLTKGGGGLKRKLTAKWINEPKPEPTTENLIERTFGAAIQKASEKPPTPPKEES